jgi:hypothetical protein
MACSATYWTGFSYDRSAMTSILPIEAQLRSLSGPADRLQWLRANRLLGPAALLRQRGVLSSELAELAQSLVSSKADVSPEQLAEERRVFSGLVESGLRALALKGCLVAYVCYPSPEQRWRADLDVLVAPAELAAARSALNSLGYSTAYTVAGGTPIDQESWVRVDQGRRYYIDLHWAMRKHPVLRDRLEFEEQWAESIELPGLAEGARGQCRVHALLNAVLHWFDKIYPDPSPYGWLLDIDLLWRQMNEREHHALRALTVERELAGLVAEVLGLVRAAFATPIPESLLEELACRGRDQRPTRLIALQGHTVRGHLFSLACEPVLSRKVHRLRSTVLPPVAYMRQRYGATSALQLLRAYWTRAWRRLRDLA